MDLNLKKIRPIVNRALREDIRKGDITTDLLVPESRRVKAKIVAREPGVVAGIRVAEEVFKAVERLVMRKQGQKSRKKNGIKFKKMVEDGDKIKKGETLAEVWGRARVILTGERTALNFLQHLSGIATLTRKYVSAVKSANPQGKIKIYDTRKTLPGLRCLEKYAVRCGGGYNHRMGLYDMVLIKDNHWQITGKLTRKGVPSGWNFEQIKKKITPGMKVEVEVDNLKQLKKVLDMDVDIVMLDNMKLPVLKKAVRLIQVAGKRKGVKCPSIEVSGKINLENIKQIARLEVDRISVGEITHSVKALDISLEIAGV